MCTFSYWIIVYEVYLLLIRSPSCRGVVVDLSSAEEGHRCLHCTMRGMTPSRNVRTLCYLYLHVLEVCFYLNGTSLHANFCERTLLDVLCCTIKQLT